MITLTDEDLTYLKRLYQTAPIPVAVIVTKGGQNHLLYANPLFDNKGYDLIGSEPLRENASMTHFTPSGGDKDDSFQISDLRLKGYDSTMRILWGIPEPVREGSNTFLTTMSHEIRSPMQAVFGMLELVDYKSEDPVVSPMIGTAKNAASNVLEILDDILDLAKMNADMFDLDNYEVPLRTLVSGIIEALQVKVHNKPIELSKHIDDSVPAVVKGDPKRLRQILMNLTSNALKFTEEGSVSIRIDNLTKQADAKHVILRFEVIDTGIGINENVQKKLFSPFTQADSSTSRKYGGTGLGLSITAKLVELMGGQVGIKSAEGQGATFWFEIPTTSVALDKADESDAVYDADLLDGMKVLSVEDHPKASLEIKNSLESAGAKVMTCKNIVEARKALAKHPFDVGIFDQSLPDGLGIDLIREVASAYPAMEIIMYTAREDEGLLYTLRSMGGDYLSKPASRQGLIRKVRDVVKIDPAFTITGAGRILLVEDTETVAEVFRQQFNKLGINADFAENGHQAIEHMREYDYDMVVTDFHMPGLDGVELARKIRSGRDGLKTRSNTPIIALSADINIAKKEVYQEKGFQEYLLKPVTLAQLQRLFIRWSLLQMQERGPNEQAPHKQEEEPANKKVTNDNHIDFGELQKRLGDINEEAKDMLEMFVQTTSPRLKDIQAAYDNRDMQRLADLAHSLRGAALSACAMNLAKLGENLEAIHEDNYSEGYPLLQAIEQEVVDIRRTVENL